MGLRPLGSQAYISGKVLIPMLQLLHICISAFYVRMEVIAFTQDIDFSTACLLGPYSYVCIPIFYIHAFLKNLAKYGAMIMSYVCLFVVLHYFVCVQL